jgi:hypothetical protein
MSERPGTICRLHVELLCLACGQRGELVLRNLHELPWLPRPCQRCCGGCQVVTTAQWIVTLDPNAPPPDMWGPKARLGEADHPSRQWHDGRPRQRHCGRRRRPGRAKNGLRQPRACQRPTPTRGPATIPAFCGHLVERLALAPWPPWSHTKTGVGALAALSYELEPSAALNSDATFFSTTPPHRAWRLRSHTEVAQKSPQRSNSGRLTG